MIAIAAFCTVAGVTAATLYFSPKTDSRILQKNVVAENVQYETVQKENHYAITVHFKWDGETAPHLYYKNVNGDSDRYTSWPGVPMTEDREGWYSYTLSEAESAEFIFNVPDKDYQTASVNGEAGEWWYDEGIWKQSEPQEYTDAEKLVHKNQIVAENANESTEWLKLNYGAETVNTETKEESIIVHYPSEWENVNLYAWNSLPVDVDFTWPGTPLQKDADGYYSYTFTSSSKVNFLFDNGQEQTADMTLTKAGEYWYSNGKWVTQKPGNISPTLKPTIDPNATIIPAKGGDFREETIYFLITTRFYDGDSGNNVHCWDENIETPEDDPAWRGDFKGLIEKLDYIKALGFSAVWITPVVENCSGLDYHGYHAINFSKVDPRYESEGVTYQDLINAAHEKGMKIIQDVVFNHTGNFGEENLAPMFDKDGSVEGGYGTIDCLQRKEDGILPEKYYDTDGMNEGAKADYEYSMRLALMKDHKDPVIDGQKNDPYNLYHHYGQFNWDFYSCQLAQIAGDCVDLNTENPLVSQYIIDAYSKYINMGVDAFRIDTVKHISRLTFNKVFNPAFKAIGGEDFFMFGEVCARSSEVWYRSQTPALSSPFYTWAESKEYPWSYYDENTLSVYEASASQTLEKKISDFGNNDVEYNAYRVAAEGELPHTINLASTKAQYNDNANDRDEKMIDGSCVQKNQPMSTNAFLEGNNYHTPDYSKASGLNVIDFQMHRNFNTAEAAFNIALAGYDNETMTATDSTIGGDHVYNDATWNVVYVDSHDYGPDRADGYRYDGEADDWAENLNLMFTFRGIPCLYYGSEVQFQKGVRIDEGSNLALSKSGRAYFGDYLEGEVSATDFCNYTASGVIEDTLNHPLAKHIQRVNKIRRAIPALQKGQYSVADIERKGIAFKRRYTDSTVDSFVCVAITKAATFNNIPNGTYQDAITGEIKKVTNGTLAIEETGKGNMRVYVLNTEKTNAPGKIGEDGTYLK